MVNDASIWRQLQQAVEEVPGWSPAEELFSLYHLALLTAPIGGDLLEIGSWCGRGTIALALAARQTPGRRVIACDLFPEWEDWSQNDDGSYSLRVTIDGREFGAYETQTVWREPFERDIAPLYAANPSLRGLFDACVARFGLSDLVDVVRGDSDILCAGLAPTRCFGVAFVDGDHSYEAVCRDIANLEPHLLRGSWLAFDDAFTSYDGVNRAITDKVCNSAAYTDGTQFSRKMFAARRQA